MPQIGKKNGDGGSHLPSTYQTVKDCRKAQSHIEATTGMAGTRWRDAKQASCPS